MEHSEVRDRLEAYALGALDADEAEAVAAHVPGCPDCRAELAAYRRVADGLSPALAAATPLRVHPSLKRRLLAVVQAPPLRTRRRPFRAALWPAAAILALAAFAVSTVWALELRQEVAHVQADSLRKMDGTLSQDDQRRVLEVVDSSATVRRSLQPVDTTSTYSSAYGKLWSRNDSDDVVVMVNKLPAPPSGEHYELLVDSGGRSIDCGELVLDRDGFAILLFKADGKGPRYDRAAVTLEGTTILAFQGSN